MTADKTVVLSLDFRLAGVPNRFQILDAVPGTVHAPLEPLQVPAPDIPSYIEQVLSPVPDLRGQAVIVTFCMAYGLAGEVARVVRERGGVVNGLVAVDPVRPTAQNARSAYLDVLGQFGDPTEEPSTEPVWLARPHEVYGQLGRFADMLTTPVESKIRTALDLDITGDDDDPAAAVAAELSQRYAIWLRHVLACYGAAGAPVPMPVTVVASHDYDLVGADLGELSPGVVRRCTDDVFTCGCLRDVVRQLSVGTGVASNA